MKIAVGVPHTGHVTAQTVVSLIGLMAKAEHPLHFVMQGGCYIHENRTIIVRKAQEAGATHLFFLDSDIECPDDTITRLLAHQKPIVGGMYNMRQMPPANTIKFKDAEGKMVAVAGEDIPKELFTCYAIPTGCMLVDMTVFDLVPLPWFAFEDFEDGKLKVGEDVWFCDRAAKAGYDIYCDPTLLCRHWGMFGF